LPALLPALEPMQEVSVDELSHKDQHDIVALLHSSLLRKSPPRELLMLHGSNDVLSVTSDGSERPAYHAKCGPQDSPNKLALTGLALLACLASAILFTWTGLCSFQWERITCPDYAETDCIFVLPSTSHKAPEAGVSLLANHRFT